MGTVGNRNDLYDKMTVEDQAEVQAERARSAHLMRHPICGDLLDWDPTTKKARVCRAGVEHSGTHL